MEDREVEIEDREVETGVTHSDGAFGSGAAAPFLCVTQENKRRVVSHWKERERGTEDCKRMHSKAAGRWY